MKTHTLSTIPLFVEEGGVLRNVFYLVSKDGEVLGHYAKNYPTTSELSHGVVPGAVNLIDWQGLRIGGAICYDMNFSALFQAQQAAGADLILCPSLLHHGRPHRGVRVGAMG